VTEQPSSVEVVSNDGGIARDPEGGEAKPGSTSPKVQQSAFHFRWRILLLIPLAVVILIAYFVPRQRAQHEAIVALKELNAALRTQPVLVPGIGALMGEEYAEEVTEVYLRSPDVKDEDLSVLAGINSLQKLELAGSPITSAGMVHLRGLTNLYTLHLADTNISDEGMHHLSRLRGLAILSLDNTQITDDGLVHLSGLPQLERLYLSGTAITDQGLAHLANITSLKELACVDTAMTDAGLEHLKGLKNLEVLKVYNTQVTRAGLEQLREVIPQVVIWEPDE
jgi:Leucine-rich repeat (LRR) protein